MEQLQIKYLKKPISQELEEIESFVFAHPHANFFQSTYYHSVCQNSNKIESNYIVAYNQNIIVGILFVVTQYQFNLPVLKFLSSRNLIWGGPLVQNNDIEITEKLYIYYNKAFSNVIYTQIRNLVDTSYCMPLLKKNGFDYEPHLNILINLEAPIEELWKGVHSKRRNEIRRATKEGTTFAAKNDLASLIASHEILKEVYNRAKLPLPDLRYFEELFLNNSLKIFTALHNEKIIGCMLCIAYKDILFDYYAGAYSKFYDKYPNDLLPWEVFKWAKEQGYKTFDFGGAGKPDIPYGVRDYKMKFGGELVNFGRYEKIYYPALFKIVSFGFKIYSNLKKC